MLFIYLPVCFFAFASAGANTFGSISVKSVSSFS